VSKLSKNSIVNHTIATKVSISNIEVAKLLQLTSQKHAASPASFCPPALGLIGQWNDEGCNQIAVKRLRTKITVMASYLLRSCNCNL
jgi:hypothetical protein